MVEQSMPWTSGVGDGGPYSQDTMRLWGKVLGKADSSNLGVIPGMLLGLLPSTDQNNEVSAASGYAVVDGTLYESTAALTDVAVSSPAATTGGRLVLRKDWSVREVRLEAILNTDGNAAIPALVQIDGTTWDIPIATFTITSGGVIGAFTDVREFTRESEINIIISGDGSTITTGIKGDIEIPFDLDVLAVRMYANQSGSIVVDIWKDSYVNYPPVVGDSVTASAKPTITTDVKSEDTTLVGWTRRWSKGEILRWNVDSVTDIQRVTLALRVAAF